jgi:hypothetical protein
MLPPSDLHPLALLLLVGLSFLAVLAVIVLLIRSGRSVDFPELSTKFRAHGRTHGRDHVPIR